LGFFYKDNDLVVRNIEKAKGEIDSGGDWDRRNRLKVYEGLHELEVRNLKKAGQLFLDTLSTFTCTELFSYNNFVFYAVLLAALTLERPQLKQQVLNSPEVLSVLHEIPHIGDYVQSLYGCNYASFFQALAALQQRIKLDQHFGRHTAYYCREMRIRSYAQLLQSYKSLQLKSMAAQFQVSEAFLDRELSRFVASGRLHCKIDKVGGIVETTRPDSTNALYARTIRDGDLLLNRLQKISRVVNL